MTSSCYWLLIQKELKGRINLERQEYRDKIESNFAQNDTRRVWSGIQLMSGYTNVSVKFPLLSTSLEYSNGLNKFYSRLDCDDFTVEFSDLKTNLNSNSKPFLSISEHEVRRNLSYLHSSKAAGPDTLSPIVLKILIANLLLYLLIYSINVLVKYVIPIIWKQSCIIHVPKKSTISFMNDLRPVALTSVSMKVLRAVYIARFLKSAIADYVDPLQFAYSNGRCTEDAILFILNKLFGHLDETKLCKHSSYYVL